MVTAQLSPTRRKAIARWARAQLARRSLAKFCQYAVQAGVIDGTSKIEWGPHLDAICMHTQMQLEAWLVAYGKGSDEMVARQKEAWERTGATWEDGKPEPWQRYVLVQNAITNCPPGTWKSSASMVCANAWIWLWDPKFSFAALSGISSNVGRDSRATRELVRSSWYRETFEIAWTDKDLDPSDFGDDQPLDVTIRKDMDAVDYWGTTAGGKRISRTVSRGLTGTHTDGVFLDDSEDAEKVFSEAERIRPQNRWTAVIENRVNDEHRSIRHEMQQIVHPEGMTWYLTSLGRWTPETPKGWAQMCIPAEFGHGPDDAPKETPWGWRDWRTFKGETIHPRLSPGVLADKRSKMAYYEWQYNQNASGGTSGMFERKHARWFIFDGQPMPTRRRPEYCIQRSDLPPVVVKRSEVTRLTLSVDAQASLDPDPTSKTVSAVGLIVGGCWGDNRVICDDRTRVLGPDATYMAIYELISAWPLDTILVELKALGASVIVEIERSIRRGWYLNDKDEQAPLVGPDGHRPRCTVEPFNPGKDSKEQRWLGMLPPWKQGEIYLLDGADWLYPTVDINRRTMDEGFIGEICSLPNSRRKDRGDSMAQFIAHYRETSDPRSEWRAMRRLALVGGRR